VRQRSRGQSEIFSKSQVLEFSSEQNIHANENPEINDGEEGS